MKCAEESCGAEIEDGAKFCSICGTKVRVTTIVKKAPCLQCDNFVLESHNFCPRCGWKVEKSIFEDRICRAVQRNDELCNTLLKFDTKNCPSCGTPTMSIDGDHNEKKTQEDKQHTEPVILCYTDNAESGFPYEPDTPANNKSASGKQSDIEEIEIVYDRTKGLPFADSKHINETWKETEAMRITKSETKQHTWHVNLGDKVNENKTTYEEEKQKRPILDVQGGCRIYTNKEEPKNKKIQSAAMIEDVTIKFNHLNIYETTSTSKEKDKEKAKLSGENESTVISHEEENYARMCLLLYSVSPCAVRALFDREFNPSSLAVNIRKEHTILTELRKRKIINKQQWDLLFPPNGCPNSNRFDLTLLITLLTNLTELNSYNNKLPLKTDVTPSADLERIKFYRNDIAHNIDGKIENSFFGKAWDDISEAVGRLGGQHMLDECKNLKTKQLDPSVPWNIRVQNNDIFETWKTNKSTFVETRAAKHVLDCVQKNSCVTITASSGVGKTAILQHVALQMADEGYDILPVNSPHDIVKFNNPNQKTLFVIDDLCGTYSINQTDLNNWESVLPRIKLIIKNNLTRIIVTCRLQVLQDDRFETLLIFKKCVCNLLTDDLCLSQTEKKLIAERYLETKASQIIQYCDIYDCFPLLCMLYRDNQVLNIEEFFLNPFSVYAAEIEKLHKNGHYSKYCSLALCVMFDNRLRENWFTEEFTTNIKTILNESYKLKKGTFFDDMFSLLGHTNIKTTTENTCQACKLDRGTSPLVILDEMNSLVHSFLKIEHGVYTTKHAKIFDFLVFYFAKQMIHFVLKNASISVISQRFVLEKIDGMDQFITVVPPEYHLTYIQRIIKDWSEGIVSTVFLNINMNIREFRERFLSYLNTLDISIQKQLALKCDDLFGDTFLSSCCHYDNIPLVQWCINHGVDVNKCNAGGHSPLIISSQEGHAEIVKILLQNKGNVNHCAADGASPLHIACLKNHIDIVKILLYNNANINGCRNDGTFPLYIACHLNNIEIVKVLLDNHADIDKCSDYGESSLYVACQSNHKEIVKILLDYKADVNKCRNDAVSPLHIASLNNHMEIVKLLLDNKADVDKCENHGASPLYLACMNNHREIVKILLANNANIDKGNDDGTSPLLYACAKNHIDIVKLLLDNNANINKRSVGGEFALHYAILMNHIDIVNILLDNNPVINMCRDDGYFPLYTACHLNNIEIVKVLLDNHADINKCTYNDESPLYVACNNNNIEIVKLLLEYKAKVNKWRNNSPLLNACSNNYVAIVKVLLENQAEVNKYDGDGISPLYVACQNNHIETVKILLDNNADVNKCTFVGTSFLQVACYMNHVEIVKILLDYKADIYECRNGRPCLVHVVCQENHIDILKLLLKKKGHINSCVYKGGFPLNTACQSNNLEIVKLLLDNHANINKQDYDGASPLFIACQKNYIAIVKLLLKRDADVNLCLYSELSPLYISCQNNHTEVLKLLLQNNADINKRTRDGQSPLDIGCFMNHIEIVKILLDNNALINECGNDGAYPLQVACQNSHIDIVKALIDNNADINKCGINRHFPLFVACQNNRPEIVKLLLNNNANVNKCSLYEVSPLHIVCFLNNIETVQILLDNSADINKRNYYGQSPLRIACDLNNIEIVKILLDYNAELF